MADKVSFVICPSCKREYYLERASYLGHENSACICPFCKHEFAAREGNPRPPLTA